MSGPHHPTEPAPGAAGPAAAAPPRDGVTDLVRWAAFSCFLVPVVLLWYGASLAGTAGTALGLAAVTGACRLLLRRSARVAARPAGPDSAPRAGHRHRAAPPARRGGRHAGENTPVG
ncbi:hypothetical protein SAM23877_2826 [Streptomyces ambofaciens ATCC 23877]|uniref:Uncharacterized protein n=2 Tax=Streptomyces ambofaciens TaxID=1889 RepID=A0A0K2ARW6_STRA7|nr:hypothetical protein [Streptomyces ambofaciens]AKZ55875.1 hypothetical protein SAM23877_2826 [Streptomyces ambofaciens ATCC 23877]ANB06550.1 hypothetical protein SAM40697_2591 [Streptomyces ambofaciens]